MQIKLRKACPCPPFARGPPYPSFVCVLAVLPPTPPKETLIRRGPSQAPTTTSPPKQTRRRALGRRVAWKGAGHKTVLPAAAPAPFPLKCGVPSVYVESRSRGRCGLSPPFAVGKSSPSAPVAREPPAVCRHLWRACLITNRARLITNSAPAGLLTAHLPGFCRARLPLLLWCALRACFEHRTYNTIQPPEWRLAAAQPIAQGECAPGPPSSHPTPAF